MLSLIATWTPLTRYSKIEAHNTLSQAGLRFVSFGGNIVYMTGSAWQNGLGNKPILIFVGV